MQGPTAQHQDNDHNDDEDHASLSSSLSSSSSYSASSTPTAVHTSSSSSSAKSMAVLSMTMAMSIHFSGYELARNSLVALFTSETTGFLSPSALPLAVGCVSPFSVGLLWIYSVLLQRFGPRKTLWISSMGCLAVLEGSGWILRYLIYMGAAGLPIRVLVFGLFVFQNSYVNLLYTQHWSFISSVLSETQGARWFAPISGVGSLSSTLAAAAIASLAPYIGLSGMLLCAGIICGLSGCFADWAYHISETNDFCPHPERAKKRQSPTNGDPTSHEKNLMQTAYQLFQRVPVLGMLFMDTVVSQCLSSLVNFLFMVKLKEAISNDVLRAGWSGNCYASINAISGILQFFILPFTPMAFKSRWVWVFMPALMGVLLIGLNMQQHSSLLAVCISFAAMKIMEYSLRGVANGLIYVSLDYESRFLGKEIMSLFANRLGKSGMALVLSLVTSLFPQKSRLLQRIMSLASCVVAALWLVCAIRLWRRLTPVCSTKKEQ